MIAQNTLAEKERVIELQQPKVEYHNKVLQSGNLLTITDIAKDLGLSGTALNKILCEQRIIFMIGNSYKPYADYQWIITDD